MAAAVEPLEGRRHLDATFSAVADAFVRGGADASKNFGAAAVLEAKLTSDVGFTRNAYLKFDLSKLVGNVGSVKLRLYGNRHTAADKAGLGFAVKAVASTTWGEKSINWGNKPAQGSTIAIGTVTATQAGWQTVDVTSYVKQQLAKGVKTISLAVVATSKNTDAYFKFDAREAAGSNEAKLVVTSPAPALKDLAAGKPAIASSYDGPTRSPDKATDGIGSTRWSTAKSGLQWLQTDLGRTASVRQISIDWGDAFAKSYRIETSTNGSTWTPIASRSNSDGKNDTLTVSATARFVRIACVTPATSGYSVWNFKVLGA